MTETICTLPNFPHIALLTDFHNTSRYELIIKKLRDDPPQLIAIAGDIVYGRYPLSEQEYVLPFLSACVSIAPTYMSLGNHELVLTDNDIEKLRAVGVTIMDNDWTEHGGLVIGGMTSGYIMARRSLNLSPKAAMNEHIEKPQRKPDLSWLPDYAAVHGCHILLCHHPEYFEMITQSLSGSGIVQSEWLILSGHAHGGQWRFYDPFRKMWRGVFAPGQGLFPKYTKGIYSVNESSAKMIVSAGLANTIKIPRIFNDTEIVHIIPTEGSPSDTIPNSVRS